MGFWILDFRRRSRLACASRSYGGQVRFWIARQAARAIPAAMCAAMMLSPSGALAEEGGGRTIVPIGAGHEELRLPPLAQVLMRDRTGKMWDIWGTISGSFPVAANDFQLCLSGQGWEWHTDQFMGNERRQISLTVWKKGRRRLLVMLWDQEAGRTGFSVGETSDEELEQDGWKAYQEGRTQE